MKRGQYPGIGFALAALGLAGVVGSGIATPPAAFAQETSVRWSALLDLRHGERDREVTRLAPRKGFVGQPRRESSATAVLSGEVAQGAFTLQGQARAFERSNSSDWSDSDLEVDEFFVESQLTERAFAFVGRRNLAFGQAYGFSPADVFLDPRAEEQSLNETRRRRELRGQDLVGVEAFVSDNATLLAFVAPANGTLNRRQPDRFLVSANLVFPEWDMDATLLAFDDEREGVAWSTSAAVGQALVVYVDGALRRGRDRSTVEPVGPPAQGSFRVVPRDEEQLQMSMTAGGGYTFGSGVSVNLEYFRNADGYTSAEWSTIEDLIRLNAANFNARAFGGGALPEGNLKRLNAVLDVLLTRQNYAFGRVAAPEPWLWKGFSAELTVLQNLDDASGLLSTRLEQDFRQRFTLGAHASFQYGDSTSEFGLRPAAAHATFYATLRFP